MAVNMNHDPDHNDDHQDDPDDHPGNDQDGKTPPNVIPIRAISKSRHGGARERNTLGREQIKNILSFPRNI